jgi:hypothetical protein
MILAMFWLTRQFWLRAEWVVCLQHNNLGVWVARLLSINTLSVHSCKTMNKKQRKQTIKAIIHRFIILAATNELDPPLSKLSTSMLWLPHQ